MAHKEQPVIFQAANKRNGNGFDCRIHFPCSSLHGRGWFVGCGRIRLVRAIPELYALDLGRAVRNPAFGSDVGWVFLRF